MAKFLIALFALACVVPPARAEAPVAMYIFPAGGQRGTQVDFRVGGLYLHDSCPFAMTGDGVAAPAKIDTTETVWFEGPVVPLPDSQQAEDYPRDLKGTVTIAADAVAGLRTWRVWTDQGAAPSRPFLVGELPEVIEQEIDGEPIPVAVALPVTVNGRLFPREDVDVWKFEARAGQTITCAGLTGRLGSPFDARLEIRDSRGAKIAESTEIAPPGIDAFVRFTAPADGTYSVRIHDVKFGGLQHYVYRLTLTAGPFVDRVFPLGGRRGTAVKFETFGVNLPAGPVELTLPNSNDDRWIAPLCHAGPSARQIAVELDDLPELVESEPNDLLSQVEPIHPPVVCNGRIGRAGDVDFWGVYGKKGTTLEFDVRAARLGSALDSVLSLVDREGKELARSDDANLSDSFLRFTFPEDGPCFVKIEERVASRGSGACAYRLRVAPPRDADFSLQLPADAITVNRGGEVKLKLGVDRVGSIADLIPLEFENLPPGVSASTAAIPANAAAFDVVFKADASAPVGAWPVRIRGTATIAGKPVVRQAAFRSQARDEIVADSVFLAVALPTPFKVKGTYEVKYAQRGGKFVRHFSIDRGGFEGPLRVRLADRQARHLQGVTGPAIDVAAGATEFDYPVFLPPWMEIGRTSRTVVMATGEVTDADGSRHTVSFTSLQQNEQIVALVDPGQLSIELDRQSIVAAPGDSSELTVTIGRGQGVNVPVRIELVLARHIKGVVAEPVTLAADQSRGTMAIRFSGGSPGPFNMPLVVRATALKGANDTVVAETKLDVVSPPF